MSTQTEIGDLFEVDLLDSMSLSVDEQDWNTVDAAWSRFVDSGKTRDEIVQVTKDTGSVYRFLVSRIIGLDKTTRESRRAARERSIALKAEKHADGLLDD